MVKEGQKYLRPYEDPIPVVEDITGRRIVKVAFLLFGKVNRCLARYSPRTTTTNQPTNKAPNEQARPGPK